MPTFLFWNLNKKPLQASLTRLVELYDPDILLFAECSLSPSEVLDALNSSGKADYHYAPNITCTKIAVFPRFSDRFMPVIWETDRTVIRRLALPNSPEILLAATHMISKTGYRDLSQLMESVSLSSLIKDAEAAEGHRRTLLVGDLNMNPFEEGLIAGGALNAVMARAVAHRGSRTIQGTALPFFYNPMWSFFGDKGGGLPGTYYYDRSDHECYYWNIYDQVLIRPDLLDIWEENELNIIWSDGEDDFLDQDGRRGHRNMSDHLPIVFRLNF